MIFVLLFVLKNTNNILIIKHFYQLFFMKIQLRFPENTATFLGKGHDVFLYTYTEILQHIKHKYMLYFC